MEGISKRAQSHRSSTHEAAHETTKANSNTSFSQLIETAEAAVARLHHSWTVHLTAAWGRYSRLAHVCLRLGIPWFRPASKDTATRAPARCPAIFVSALWMTCHCLRLVWAEPQELQTHAETNLGWGGNLVTLETCRPSPGRKGTTHALWKYCRHEDCFLPGGQHAGFIFWPSYSNTSALRFGLRMAALETHVLRRGDTV